MSEPGAGSDVQAIACRAERDGEAYVVDGTKMWVTNGLRAGLVVLLCKTDPAAEPAHKGMSLLYVEKEPGATSFEGITIPPNIPKMGYHGVETTELVFEDHRVPAGNLLGEEGDGFRQVMDGIEVGRVNVSARAVGVATRAFEEAIRYAQVRKAFGKPIAQHQMIQEKLADMGTRLEAARLMLLHAATRKSAGERSDLEAGMAKYFTTEMCHRIVTDALRIHGGYGYSAEYTVERLYRDAPFLLIGEGTSEIQKLVIARQLLERYRVEG
jgi:butyryl-CoA dehydrogenase